MSSIFDGSCSQLLMFVVVCFAAMGRLPASERDANPYESRLSIPESSILRRRIFNHLGCCRNDGGRSCSVL